MRAIIKQISKNKLCMYMSIKEIGHVFVSDTGYVYYLDIKKEYRGQGYGAQLMRSAINRGGYWLHIEEPNQGAKKFYKRMGFEEIPTSNYLKLYVKSDKLSQFKELEKRGSLRKMLGDLGCVNEVIFNYNHNQSIRTEYDENGYQIK